MGLQPPLMGLQPQAQVELRAVPGVLQSLGMLALAHDEVVDAVEAALETNPMLERAPGHPCPECGRHISGHRCLSCVGSAPRSTEVAVSPFESLEALAGCEVRTDCRHALAVVIDHLTDRGLLDSEPEEIATAHRLQPEVVAEALRAIKVVGPVGVGERTVPDLLSAQARQLVAAGQSPPWLVELVHDHLDLVADDDAAGAAKVLGVDRAAVAAAFSVVRSRLRPIALLTREPIPPPRSSPDIFVSRGESGCLQVDLADSRWFGLRAVAVSPDLRTDKEASAWLRKHECDAQKLLKQLDVRSTVLQRVATIAVQRQAGFFDHGPAGHVPLSRTDVASELGLHPSTVARAVRGKVLRAPNGALLEFADLFGNGVAIRAQIAELTGGPALSDAQLCAALASHGHTIARRTVAKYRTQLGIAAGAARRR
jgi:RNA polymerase sigma-54 factor